MKKIFSGGVFLLLLNINLSVSGQSGEELFKSTCTACHTINGGRLIGPDLSGVYNRQNNEWLIKFIRSSQAVVKSGDPDAVAIFNEFNKIPMPDNNLSDEQILSIIDFIKSSDQGAKAPATQTAAQPVKQDSLARPDSGRVAVDSVAMKYTGEFSADGRALFNGTLRFVNNAAPCMSCHNINDQSVLGGGKLALDLTYSWSKLGPAGINAILLNPPFPVMKTALLNKPLADDEITAIISLLKSVDERNAVNRIWQSGGILFFTLGFVISLFVLVHIFVFYDNRNIP